MRSRRDFYFDSAENGSAWAHSAQVPPDSFLFAVVVNSSV